MKTDPDRIPTARELADPKDVEKARARGERLGFEGIFLDNFISRELEMMVKWRNRAKYSLS